MIWSNCPSRGLPPPPGDYVVVPGSQGPRRDFRISVGLREGWDAEGRVFDVSKAVRTARAWMKRPVDSSQPAFSGMFTRAEVTYAWPRDDGTVGSDREPVALFTGGAVHAHLGHLSIRPWLDDATCRLRLHDSATLALEAVSVVNETAPNIRVLNEYGEQASPADLQQFAQALRTALSPLSPD